MLLLLLLLLQDGLRVAVQLVGPGHLVRTARGGAHELMADALLKRLIFEAEMGRLHGCNPFARFASSASSDANVRQIAALSERMGGS